MLQTQHKETDKNDILMSLKSNSVEKVDVLYTLFKSLLSVHCTIAFCQCMGPENCTGLHDALIHAMAAPIRHVNGSLIDCRPLSNHGCG